MNKSMRRQLPLKSSQDDMKVWVGVKRRKLKIGISHNLYIANGNGKDGMMLCFLWKDIHLENKDGNVKVVVLSIENKNYRIYF